MRGSSVDAMMQFFRTRAYGSSEAEPSDGQLLERFIQECDAASLEALVIRHGRMVWGVCRRHVRDHHDAEDAFQATFLVLARRAGSIMPRDKVGSWLYGVAYQTALKARATRAKKRRREPELTGVPEPAIASSFRRDDLAELLDHELSRLPRDYRSAIVLCELEGRSHGEAAARLGWPIGTLSGRLSRARALLTKRMIRHGVSASGGTLAILLARQSASANLPPALVAGTVREAVLFATGQIGSVAPEVGDLARKVLRNMQLAKLKVMVAVAMTLGLIGAGAWQANAWGAINWGSPTVTPMPSAVQDGAALRTDSFHVTVTDTSKDNAVDAEIVIAALPGSTAQVLWHHKGKDTSSTLSTSLSQPNAKLVFTIKGEQSDNAGARNLELTIGCKVGGISSTSSQSVSMPADAKRVVDVVKLPMKSGEYRYDEETKIIVLNDSTYSIVVSKPK